MVWGIGLWYDSVSPHRTVCFPFVSMSSTWTVLAPLGFSWSLQISPPLLQVQGAETKADGAVKASQELVDSKPLDVTTRHTCALTSGGFSPTKKIFVWFLNSRQKRCNMSCVTFKGSTSCDKVTTFSRPSTPPVVLSSDPWLWGLCS